MILQHPDERLRQVSTKVTDFSEVPQIVAAMKSAIRVCEITGTKTLGLAAIQIGIPKCVVMVKQGGQLWVLVNPVIVKQQGVQTVNDGCLSVKCGTEFKVRTRPRWVQVDYQNEGGFFKTRRAEGIHAAAIAHEIDHLFGILFNDEEAA